MAIYELENPGNYVLGAGRIFVKDPAENEWYYLAESPSLAVSVEATRNPLWSSDGPTAEKLEDPTTQMTRTGTTSFRDINAQTLRRFFAASVETVTEAGSVANTQQFADVVLGAYYQIGAGVAAAPDYGWRGLANVSIEADPAGVPVPLVLGTDYEIDTEEGMFRLLSTSANVADGDTIEVTFDVSASTTELLKTGEAASEELEVKFIADNTVGDNRTFYFPKCDMGPAGEMALKSRDTYMEVPVTFEILDPNDGRSAAYIFTKPVV